MSSEVRIAGAGIAGMTAAINLAKAGHRVELLEARSAVGARFDRDYQFFENWTSGTDVLVDLRQMNLEVDFPVLPVEGADVWDHKRRAYRIRGEQPLMYMVRRGPHDDCLDASLKRQAVRAGVRLRFNCAVRPADVDIVATGPDARRSLVFVRGASFDTDLPDEVRVLFDPEVAPKVYAYMVTRDGNAILCTAYTKEYHYRKRGRVWIRDAIAAFQAVRPFQVHHIRYFNNFGISPLVGRNRKVVVGEAAGFQDVTFGFGMRLAALSGHLAARCVVEGSDYWGVASDLMPRVASSGVNRLLLESIECQGPAILLALLGRSGAPRHLLERIYRPRRLKTCAYQWLRGRLERRQARIPGRQVGWR
jgi:flavin-dependent dehydrogenase